MLPKITPERPIEVLPSPLFYLQGRIFFDHDGIRGGRRLIIYQMRFVDGNGDILLIMLASHILSPTVMRCICVLYESVLEVISLQISTIHSGVYNHLFLSYLRRYLSSVNSSSVFNQHSGCTLELIAHRSYRLP